MVKNRNAFAPFALGTVWRPAKTSFSGWRDQAATIVGKDLALSDLRYVTGLLASKYDVSFASCRQWLSCWARHDWSFHRVSGAAEAYSSRPQVAHGIAYLGIHFLLGELISISCTICVGWLWMMGITNFCERDSRMWPSVLNTKHL